MNRTATRTITQEQADSLFISAGFDTTMVDEYNIDEDGSHMYYLNDMSSVEVTSEGEVIHHEAEDGE